MSVQDDFIGGILSCQSAGFTFPAIGDPGLPNMCLGMFGSALAGINYILEFIPPTPENLPTPPGIGIFITGFMAGINIPGGYPEFSFGPITIPEKPGVVMFDASGLFKLAYAMIILPFEVIKGIITGIIDNLTIAIPSIAAITAILEGLLLDIGLAGDAVVTLVGCLATGLFNLLTALVPV